MYLNIYSKYTQYNTVLSSLGESKDSFKMNFSRDVQ